MNDLCTVCLCNGRKLVYIGETSYYNLYAQILNEIPIYDLSQVAIRVCWECHARLRRLQQFKDQAKHSYSVLLALAGKQEEVGPISSNLRVHNVYNINFTESSVKIEDESCDIKDIKQENVPSPGFDDEHCEETFVNDLNVDPQSDVENVVEFKPKKKDKPKQKKKKKAKLKEKPPEIEIEQEIQKFEDQITEKLEADEEKSGFEAEDQLMCQECGDTFRSKSLLSRHVAKEHRQCDKVDGKPKCGECGKVFSSMKTYRYHCNVLHKGQNRHPCPRCGKVYQWKSNLGRHMRSHKASDSGELYCATCDKRFASVATYRQHLRLSLQHIQPNDYTFTCDACGKKFVTKRRLRDHIDWEHLKKINFQCRLCHKAFKCHTSLYVHTQNLHRDKEKKENLCHVCGKSYQIAAKLKYHITAKHSGETPYRCAQCSAAFGWYSSLYRHVREVHYKEKLQPSRKSKKSKRELTTLLPALPTVHGP